MKMSIQKKKWECPYITDQEIKFLVESFIEIFKIQALTYPDVAHYFSFQTLENHENRLAKLEQQEAKKTTSNKGRNAVSLSLDYFDDTIEYSDKYQETLFLHKDLPESEQIHLKDLFVIPEARRLDSYGDDAQKIDYDNITQAIADFINGSYIKKESSKANILFIEAQAAMGKSSLVSWLAWQYTQHTPEAKKVLHGKNLITICLHDMLKNYSRLNIQAPFEDIYSYLLGEEKYEMTKRERIKIGSKLLTNSILVLDGFDELCMVENIIDEGKQAYFYNMHRELLALNCNCKIIITTRPNYINVSSLDFIKGNLEVKPFSEKKRDKWITKYTSKEPLQDEMREQFLSIPNSSIKCLIETPLVLYMIAAKKVFLAGKSHIWEIYNSIFTEEVYKRNYDQHGPHAINQYKNALYELTTEIAYAVSGEQHFFITLEKLMEKGQIKLLIEKLEQFKQCPGTKREKMKNILSDCFGIASYFKVSKRTEKGIEKAVVEFYHNNIKDFFCCEYIWRNLQEIYSNIPHNECDADSWFLSNFQNLFQYTVFMKDNGNEANMVVQFFKDKVLYMKEQKRNVNFINQELTHRYFTHFFGKMLATGMLEHYKYSSKENILNMMGNVYSAVLPIYQSIYLPYLEEGETLALAENEDTIPIGTSFIFRILFLIANIKNHSHLCFDGIMLSGCSMERLDLHLSSFQNCLLRHCDLRGANLRGADLRGTDFYGADLTGTDLRDTIMDSHTSFKNAIIKETKISSENKQYIQT